jgi:hypothetical protein
MLNKQIFNINTGLIYTLIGVFFVDLIRYLKWDGISFHLNAYFTVFIIYSSIIVFLLAIQKNNSILNNKLIDWHFKIYFLYLVLSIIRGFIIADSYLDYRFLLVSSLTYVLIALIFYLGNSLTIFRNLAFFYITRLLLIALIVLPLTFAVSQQLFSRLVIVASMLLIFSPYIRKKWVFLLILVIFLSHWSNPSFRVNIIKTVLSIIILAGYYLDILKTRYLRTFFYAMVILPLSFVFLGLIGQFNVFYEISKIDLYALSDIRSKWHPSQTADTRTFIYTEVITDVVNNNFILFGKSPSQAYHSDTFTNSGGAIDGYRYSSEVHILNMFLHFGIVGVILFLMFLAHIAYIGLFHSNNYLSKMLGLLILTRYTLSFLEEFTLYDLNWFFFWLIAGLISSKRFRDMSDYEIKHWLNPKLEKRVVKL